MTYINIKTEHGIETVDQFESRKEARKMLKEYNLNQAGHYLSPRATKYWYESGGGYGSTKKEEKGGMILRIVNDREMIDEHIELSPNASIDVEYQAKKYFKDKYKESGYSVGISFDKMSGIGDYNVSIYEKGRDPDVVVWDSRSVWVELMEI